MCEVRSSDVVQLYYDVGNELLQESEIIELPKGNSTSLLELLTSWEIGHLYERFIELDLNVSCFQFLDLSDIRKIVGDSDKSFGAYVKLKGNLKLWRKTNGYPEPIADEEGSTLSAPSRISSWLQDSDAQPSSSKESTPDGKKLSVEEVLKCKTGKKICDYYSANETLNDENRTLLINLILDSIVQNNRKVHIEEIGKIVDEIVIKFPNENKYIYYIPRTGKTPARGKLYDKYNNRLKCLRRKDLFPDSSFSKNKRYKVNEQSSSPLQNIVVEDYDETQIESDKIFLKYNQTDWVQCKEKWKKLFQHRTKTLSNQTDASLEAIFLEWAILKHSIGYTLICDDFLWTYGEEKSMGLLNGWGNFVSNFPKIVQRIKDSYCKELFTLIKEDTLEDSRDVIISLLLHAIIKPKRGIRIGKKGKSEFWRPTISASQDSFLIVVPSENEVLSAAEKRSTFYKNMELGCQPYIIATGDSIDNLNKFFVIVENVIYKFGNFLQALDTCFKTYIIFNLKYALECEGVWIFIENHFYHLSSTTTKISPTVATVLAELSSVSN